MRLITEHLSPTVQDAIARTKRQAFGMGGCGTPRTNAATGAARQPPGSDNCPSPPNIAGCVRPGRTCDVQRVGTTQLVTGGEPFEITILPDKSPWFQPVGVRATITDLSNSDLSHRVLFSAVEINDVPQEPINVRVPAVPVNPGDVVKGWWSDDWIDPDNYAVPVSWGWMSIEAHLNVLKIYGRALGLQATTQALVNVSLYGNPAAAPPAGMSAEQAAQPRR